MPAKQRSLTQHPLFELLSSMRFAISLLTIISIAAVIGTVLKQNEPYANYVFEFGAFWFDAFRHLGLTDVYHSAWFLLILTFLVISTSLCVWRHTPIMLREMRSYRQKATEASLKSFAHQAEFAWPAGMTAEEARSWLNHTGWSTRVDVRGDDTLIAAKRGSGHRLGYILTHVAIVVICLGGLLDGNIPLQMRQLLGIKRIETRNLPESQVPPVSRLPASNLSFRGDVTIPEGSAADVVFLDVGNGYFVQQLPFDIHLKKFRVEYYHTGQPKLFASDVVVTDKKTGRSETGTVSVNHPMFFDGIAIYQSSFGDGGSHLKFKQWDLDSPSAAPIDVAADVKGAAPLQGENGWKLEVDDFRQFNVENFGHQKHDVGMQELRDVLKSDDDAKKELHNVGPSVQFKIRDASGQAHEYLNYMMPITLDGHQYLVSGMRAAPNEPFRFVRLPVDDAGDITPFMQFRATFMDPAKREEVVRRFVDTTRTDTRITPQMRAKLAVVTRDLVKVFAQSGYDGIDALIRQSVPKDQQERVVQTYLRIVDGAAFAAWSMVHPGKVTDDDGRFLRDSLFAMDQLVSYGSPVFLQLSSYVPVEASGFQMTRAPGEKVVYLGCLFLVLGVMALFYVRERRLWLLVKPGAGRALLAFSGNRKTLDLDQDFARLKEAVAQLLRK